MSEPYAYRHIDERPRRHIQRVEERLQNHTEMHNAKDYNGSDNDALLQGVTKTY